MLRIIHLNRPALTKLSTARYSGIASMRVMPLGYYFLYLARCGNACTAEFYHTTSRAVALISLIAVAVSSLRLLERSTGHGIHSARA
ncbi:hypothetical protein OK016_29800 [Vibrio chagasii]|nr:hypothetical protein [Vibrio chagasii]